MKKPLAFAILPIFSFLIFIIEADAQCVQCTPQGRKFVCAPSPKGGRACLTNETGTTCAISQPCGGTALQISSEEIVLEERLVAEIERTEPHFAKAVSFLRKHPELMAGGYTKLYLLPDTADKQERSGAAKEDELRSILARFEEGEQNAPPVEPAVPAEYEVTLERAEGALFATLKINALSQKPNTASTSLSIHLMKAERGQWRASGWDIKPAH